MSKTTIRFEKKSLHTDLYLKLIDVVERSVAEHTTGLKADKTITKPVEVTIDVRVLDR